MTTKPDSFNAIEAELTEIISGADVDDRIENYLRPAIIDYWTHGGYCWSP